MKAIIGLGKTGLSCLQYLHKRGERDLLVMDTRKEPPALLDCQKNYANIPIHLGNLDEKLLFQAKEIIVSPGVSIAEPAIAGCIRQGISVVGDVELFAREVRAPIVGITGANAKSTVTALLGEMAKQAGRRTAVCGNIGTPVLDSLADDQSIELYVVELSSFQLETTFSLKAKVATILNISPDHLDRYPDMKAYIAAKQRIYQGAEWMVWNREDESTKPVPFKREKSLTFGLTAPNVGEWGLVERAGEYWLAHGNEDVFPMKELRLSGMHNVANALAALAMGSLIDLPLSAMLQTLREFPGLPHRCELVLEREGVRWINDSKGTNVGAAEAAIQGMGKAAQGKIILLAGGLGKGADFSLLNASVKQYVRHLVLFGTDAKKIDEAIDTLVPRTHVESLKVAISLAKREAKPGDVVLLSPACASFDMFKHYEDRGEQFKQLVRAL